jgi:hypothetical protein
VFAGRTTVFKDMVNRGADEKAGKRTQGCKDQEDHGHPGHFREEIREAFEPRFAAIQRVMRYNEEREEIEISTHASANTIGLQSLPSSGYSRKNLAGLKRTPRTVLTKLPAGFESTTFKTSRGSTQESNLQRHGLGHNPPPTSKKIAALG